MKMKKMLLLCLLCLMLLGCATYKDTYGKQAPLSLELDCRQKCGYYDKHSNPITAGVCISDCMQAQGYILK